MEPDNASKKGVKDRKIAVTLWYSATPVNTHRRREADNKFSEIVTSISTGGS